MKFELPCMQIEELANFAYLADREVRSDLCRAYIKDENDYTSNFTSAFRRNINTYTTTKLNATSHLLSKPAEQLHGCDAAIMISSGTDIKICLLEAKWPRIKSPNYRWDYLQTSAGLSHYSDQLDRQHKCHNSIAIYEMFYCECHPNLQPKYMESEGSTCVWHDEAYSYMKGRSDPDKIWNNSDLASMLPTRKKSIFEIVYEFASCKVGRPIGVDDLYQISEEMLLPEKLLFIATGEEDTELKQQVFERFNFDEG